MPTTIYDVLEDLKKHSTSEREKGDRFERLIKKFLQVSPKYQERFSEVWLWNEWPGRNQVPDTGIDLVAKEKEGEGIWAIQCKFYDFDHNLQKADIDSFFTASGKKPFTDRLIISTSSNWSSNAEEALNNQRIPVARLGLEDLENGGVDWEHFSLAKPQDLKQREKKKLRPHQLLAQKNVMDGFKKDDRGKLIMACGTGKTFTALKIAEKMAGPGGRVLFLVPSISLVSQSLTEWTNEAETELRSFAVCSDTKVGKKKDDAEDISIHDLAYPATTDPKKLMAALKVHHSSKSMTVIFSTYQSIDVIHKAQKEGAPAFDLIICDEAHRTTGVTIAGEDESEFVKIHNKDFIKGKKRLYMTATPRIYAEESKTKAKEAEAILCSMDDPKIYGEEFHKLDFSTAVKDNLLSDYKVLVLAVDQEFVSESLQAVMAKDNELNLPDAIKITGCWNGLRKHFEKGAKGDGTDPGPMRRAVAFSRSIKDSKNITKMFPEIVEAYREKTGDDDEFLTCQVDHVDGTFNALKRNDLLAWLKRDTSKEGNVCRILSNARCLAEGVDVPALDAVMFLNPRNSVVDVVQSVGRVMRLAPGKKYGYIILPIPVPANVPPDEALKDNEKYKVVWQVLQALRAHDDRFKYEVNKLELNVNKPGTIQIIGVGAGTTEKAPGEGATKATQTTLPFPNLEGWKDAIYAQVVLKCGDRRYWESWAKDVAEIAENHRSRIEGLLKGAKPKHKAAFEEFLRGLQENLNPSIGKDEAIEMLSQHLITKPVFDALFENYKFTQQNPVSLAMQKMLDLLEGENLEKETARLEKFYASVRERASGIDNAKGKQEVIVELYDKFFKTAFPRMAERLGIVYTPVDLVDFIIKSAEHALRTEFGVGLTEKGVHVLDPFTGTGTFIVRLLQNGLIRKEDLIRKFREELHANEIVLLAYYIAAINIEEAYHGLKGGAYESFEGIVLTDTFQTAEGKGTTVEAFPENNARLTRQRGSEIRVIISNPPYSVGQASENDANKNFKYQSLDEKIRQTYALHSTATLKTSLYDSYIRAFRWASDRIGEKGVVCYVTNGSFIDGNALDGFRKCLADEFTSIYCFNLRGNQRTQGELSRKEGGKIFGSGSRASIAITLLTKNPAKKGPCELFYHDIGDYLTREQKLKIITDFVSVKGIPWTKLTPNTSNDWINQGNAEFQKFVPLIDEKEKCLFETYSNGLNTARDFWVYNFSRRDLTSNVKRMIEFYNSQVQDFKNYLKKTKNPKIDEFVDPDPKKISWSADLKKDLTRLKEHEFNKNSFRKGMYRPYCQQWLYFGSDLNERVGSLPDFFPTDNFSNTLIYITGLGSSKDFSALALNAIPNRHLLDTGLCFPLYNYEKGTDSDTHSLPGFDTTHDGYVKHENVSEDVLTDFKKTYDSKITKEDVFYYVYGILHSPEYKTRFAADLKKMLPRIPFAQDFWAFTKAGRELAKWHLNYETLKPYPLKEESSVSKLEPNKHFKVDSMRFGKNGKDEDRTTIVYNNFVALKGIPLEAYEYEVNGRPALEWILDRYEVKTDKDSLITNDPNDWSDDPRYIIDLIKRIVTVSLETMKIVNSLPPLNERK